MSAPRPVAAGRPSPRLASLARHAARLGAWLRSLVPQGEPLHALALAAATAAGLAASGALPLRDAASARLLAWAGAALALVLLGAAGARRPGRVALAVGALLVAAALGAPSVLAACGAALGAWALAQAGPPQRAARERARAARVRDDAARDGTGAARGEEDAAPEEERLARGVERVARSACWTLLAALASAALWRSFDPLLLDTWLRARAPDLLAAWLGEAPVAPSVYGIGLVAVGLVGVCSASGRLAPRALGVLGLLAALLLGRRLESAWPVALAVLGLPALLVAVPDPHRVPRALLGERASELAWGALALALLVCGFAATGAFAREAQAGSAPRAPVVGFLGPRHASFEPLPTPEQSAKDYTAPPRFGAFRRQLEARGARTVDLLAPQDVRAASCDALVTINFHGEDADAFVAPVREAVRGGARLLVLADHTDLFGQREPTRALLADTGVELAFDSAVPTGPDSTWLGCLAAARDPLFAPHRDGAGLSWGVGCSLVVAPPARVLAAGTRAFLDAGTPQKPGGLGDLARGRGEPLGGFALAARSRLGAGEVLVFGDTSALQDTALLAGQPFAERLERWLVRGAPFARAAGSLDDLAASRTLAGLLLGALALASFLVQGRTLVALLALGALGVGEAWLEQRARSALAWPEPARAELVLATGRAPNVSLGLDRVEPFVELCASLGDAVRVEPGARFEPGATVVLQDPLSELTRAESERLLAHVRAGGALLALFGERGARSAHELLDALELSLGIPLGRGLESAWSGRLAERGDRPLFQSARELAGAGLRQAEVVATCFGRPVAALGTLGAGRWLVVADSGLALEKHLEPAKGGSRGGALSLQALLALLREAKEDAR